MKYHLTLIFLVFSLISSAENEYKDCGLNEKSRQLAQLIMSYTGQQRNELMCNNELAKAAEKKARLMAEADKISHYIDNTSPNELLSAEGIELPHNYAILGNQVEAVQGGADSSKEAFENFLTSYYHKQHLLGENDFYAKQNQIGVGYYYDSSKKHEDYWVVYITSLRQENEKNNIGYKLNGEWQPFVVDTLNKKKVRKVDLPNRDTRIKSRSEDDQDN